MLSTINTFVESVKTTINDLTPQQTKQIQRVGGGLFVGYLIYKAYSVGVWQHRLPNPDIPIIFHRPFFGTLSWVTENAQHHIHQLLTVEVLRLIKETGNKFLIFAAPRIANEYKHNYFIFCPKIIKLVFEDQFENYKKGKNIRDPFEPLFGDGIFAADVGTGWKFHRKVASRMFSLRNLKNYMFDCSVFNANILTDKMDELSQSIDTETMDVFELFGRFTLQSFMQTAFGEMTDIVQRLPEEHAFCSAFDQLVLDCNERTIDPLWRWKHYFKIGVRERVDIPKCSKILDDFATKVITKRLNNKDQRNLLDENQEKHDLLSLFMKHNKEYKNIINSKTEQIQNIKDIRDVTMNFVIAARDTTRILLSWFFYEITKPQNQNILTKLYQEVDKYKNEKLTYADCSPNTKKNTVNRGKYKYLESALMETLRYYPPVPFLQRYATKDTVIPYTDYNGNNKKLKIYANDGVCVYTCAYLRLPQIWGDNANEFDPSRFAQGLSSYDMYKFPVFNINPRLCMGKTQALMQAKVMAISILRKYEIYPEPNQDVDIALSPILVMRNGFKIKVGHRK